MPERKPEQEKEVMDWIEAVMGEPLPKGEYEEVRKISMQLFTLFLSNSLPLYKTGFEKWSSAV